MVEVQPIPKIAEDERGSTHYFDTDRSEQFVVGYRKAGTHNAKHYHKGLAANKNPEILLLMQGEITIHWYDVREPEKKGTCRAIAPAMVTVQAWAWHEVIADTDIIVLELNRLIDGKEDSFRV